MNKTIYMTYKKEVPDFVFSRWVELNPEYSINFSLDKDCVDFLQSNFNNYIADLFVQIPEGMYKADLWRLCKLYINGGVYADVDLVPYLNIDTLNKDTTFYSCLSLCKKGIFQAFMVNFSKPKNPLILNFLLSFLLRKPFNYQNGPTHDMYNCIKYNLNGVKILPETKYEINEIKIPVYIGSSNDVIKKIDLFYFPDDIDYTLRLCENRYNNKFTFEIKNNVLTVTRIDLEHGWDFNHKLDICIKSNETIFLFEEKSGKTRSIVDCFVSFNGTKILDSRDASYYANGMW